MSAVAQPLVEMTGVKLEFDGKVILDGVDVSLQPQEVLVIMGLSGCGKSTLLNILMGLLMPGAGSVLFKGEDVTTISRRQLNRVRTHIGMVYQNAALISSMNVRENVALPLRELSGKDGDEILEIAGQKLELVGLDDVHDKLPSELSGGMQKRAGLARALALEPELILFDEPSAGLDPINSRIIDELIIQLREVQKVTSIVVTHEMNSAFAVATRMAFLHEGKMVLEGNPDEFLRTEEPGVRDFLSSYTEDQDRRSRQPGTIS